MNPKDRICYVTFDKIALTPALQYVRSEIQGDFIRGFQDMGNIRTKLFADKAMVFMVRGIRTAWKQPVSYYFPSEGNSFFRMSVHVNFIIAIATTANELLKIVNPPLCECGLNLELTE